MTIAIDIDVRHAPADAWSRRFRPSLLIVLLLGLLNIWLARHPPMTDIPQHAAQVALGRDLMGGGSAWADLVRINLWTPYLLAYSLLLPLAAIFPVATAIKIVLSVAYLAFVTICSALRREFGADERLDIYAAVGFFSFSYAWGFLTFLAAAPLALLFVFLSIRLNERPSLARAGGLLVVGLLLLISHGLAFIFGYLLAGALFAWRWIGRRDSLLPTVPYFALAAITIGCLWWVRSPETVEGAPFHLEFIYGWNIMRFVGIVRLPFGDIYTNIDALYLTYAAILAVFITAPWVMGLRIDPKRLDRLIPFIFILCIVFGVPSRVLYSAFIYERFGLFLLPAYAWAFGAAPNGAATAPILRARLAQAAIVAASLCALAIHLVHTWRFALETRAFDAAVARLDESQRALTLVFQPQSIGAADRNVYVHYPAWYQAEHKGFVDFNFACCPPAILRFRRDRAPAISRGFEWAPQHFDWVRDRGSDYRYFFARGIVPDHLFDGADCPPSIVWSGDDWTIFERCGKPH